MSKALTPDLIMARTKTNNLTHLKKLNLWGNDIEDIRLIREMKNLEILSLSVNKIKTLRDIGYCEKIKELYLRNNQIKDFNDLKYLVPLQDLEVLWLSENPISYQENYRKIVAQILPQVKLLDNVQITNKDREDQTNSYMYDNQQNEEIFAQDIKEDYIEQEEKKYEQQIPKFENYQKMEPPILFGKQQSQKQSIEIVREVQEQQLFQRNQNIVCAIMSLVKELDPISLEYVYEEIKKKIQLSNQFK